MKAFYRTAKRAANDEMPVLCMKRAVLLLDNHSVGIVGTG